MSSLPIQWVLVLAGILFLIGLTGLLIRRNLIFTLISIEIILNSVGLVFISAGSYWKNPDGQIMFLFILSMAAAEVSIGLALILRIVQQIQTLDSDQVSLMKG